MNHWKWWGVAGIILSLLVSCGKEKPLPVGYESIFGDKEGLIVDSVLVQTPGTEKFYPRLLNSGLSTSLLLGNYENYRSAIYLKFDKFPDSSQFHSAKIKLFIQEKIGPQDSTYWKIPHSFKAQFYLSDFDWNNTEDPEQYLQQLPFNGAPFQTNETQIDTTYIEFALDTLTVKGWADSTIANHGIWIQSPDAEFISNFYSWEILDASLMPQLGLIFTYKDSLGAHLDTSTVYAAADAYLFFNSEASLNLDKNNFYIGRGFSFRSFMKFDLSGLDSTIHLNRAIMKMTINRANSIRNAVDFASDCRLYRLDQESWEKGVVNEEPNTGIYSGTLADSILTFDLTPSVQGWLGNKYPNYGLLVRSINEGNTLSRVAFYSSNAEDSLQPRLYLYYTLPPKQEFENPQ